MSIYEREGEIAEILISTIDQTIKDVKEGKITSSLGDLANLTRSIARTREGEEKRELYFFFLQLNTLVSVFRTGYSRLRRRQQEIEEVSREFSEIEESIKDLKNKMQQIAPDILEGVKKGMKEGKKEKVVEAFERGATRITGEIFDRFLRGRRE